MVLTSPAKGAIPIYRYYKGGDHFYTTNAKEIGTTTPRKRGNHGYVSEGIAGYCYPTQKKVLFLSTDIGIPARVTTTTQPTLM